ncbi:hypothetical protein B0I35DRAFT_215403 [Stachybotrys elegans]|uniref:DUF7896 domain-containing protein n=1 Tax=Stachybotrys elegans TaxID=80388 RepID=A0A8K0SX57_9HYPO|nr:hypothetical protein B0I35DRAFT_215403 [Stachybotrys elegans]
MSRSQSMSRSVSNRSESAGMPFRRSGGPIAPLTISSSPGLNTHSQFCHSPNEAMGHRLQSVEENSVLSGIGVDPDVFLANYGTTEPSYIAMTRNNMFALDAQNQPLPSACPSMVSTTTVNEGPLPMTRQNSSFGGQLEGGMTRLASSQSQTPDAYLSPHSPYHLQFNLSQPGEKRPGFDQDLVGLGANLPQAPAHQYTASSPPHNMLMLSPTSVTMDRSDSNSSMASAKSTASNQEQRAKEARARVLQNSKAVLAPKPLDSADEGSSSDGPLSSPSHKKDDKTPAKAGYQRPKHPKVYCIKCSQHPEGFRGEHELRRHMSAKHGGTVKKFVCRDPATVGLVSNVQVQHPLSKCKACKSGKQYGAYYNAAAHLRRTHFNPKSVRGKKGADERRGGKGGGDDPPMSELKAWFTEIWVNVDQSSASNKHDNSDEDMMESSAEPDMDMFPTMDASMPGFNMTHDEDLPLGASVNPMVVMGTAGMPALATDAFDFSSLADGGHMATIAPEYMAGQGAYGSSNVAAFPDMGQMGVAQPLWPSEV